jgi:hypothetical protein
LEELIWIKAAYYSPGAPDLVFTKDGILEVRAISVSYFVLLIVAATIGLYRAAQLRIYLILLSIIIIYLIFAAVTPLRRRRFSNLALEDLARLGNVRTIE